MVEHIFSEQIDAVEFFLDQEIFIDHFFDCKVSWFAISNVS